MDAQHDLSVKELELRRKLFDYNLFGFIIFGAILSFLSQPFLKYLNPLNVFVVGIFLASTNHYLYRTLVLRVTRYYAPLAYILGAISFVLAGMTISDGYKNFKNNEAICSSLQIEMTSQKTDFDKKATLFSALGCRYKHNPAGYLK